jgi:NAD(P)-dependent dehydrogenase (short-subunit alcohol dehydrogenase family)
MMTTIQQSDLQGLKALVTGATSGLGRAIAVQLARDGADVTVHGRDAGRGVQTVEEIQLQGGTARFVAADLADATSIVRFAKEVGDIDILVNNAGFSMWGPTETFEIASFDAMFAANVRRRSSSSARSRRAWRPVEPGASSTSAAWPAASVSPAARRMGPPKRRSPHSLKHGQRSIAPAA